MAEDEGVELPVPAGGGDQVAVPLASNAFGAWDGSCFFLRSFPVWYRWWQVANVETVQKMPESGTVNGVQFEQSMGKMSLWYPLVGADADLTEQDFFVEMSTWELRVSVGGEAQVRGKPSGRKIDALCGELYADIRRPMSWWDLTVDEAGTKFLVLHLTKSLHKAWKGPWYKDPLNPHRKMTFGWTTYHMTPQKTEDDKLTRCFLGQAEGLNDKALCTGMTAERLCTGIDEEEDDYFVYVVVHLDEEAVEVATDRVPMEDLFAADVRADSVEVYLRYDGFRIFSGQLRRACFAEMATWEFTNVRRKNLPKGSTIRCPAFYNPALRIKVPKDEASQGLWGGVFTELLKPDFEPPRERMTWTERVQRALVLSPGAPLKSHVKTERALKMCTRVECSQDTVTQRAQITLHLDEALEELAFKFKLDLTTFFSLKVGERMLEVSVVADAEFTMCVGKLGGAVEPTKTSWEITRERNGPGDEKEHLALKIGLAKAEGFKERWAEVFTKLEPWQVSESLHSAAAASLQDGEAGEGAVN